MLKHPREHVVRQQADIFGEHAEDQPVDEVRHGLWLVAPFAERLRKLGEGRSRAFRHRLAALARPKPLRVGHCPLELVPGSRVREVLQCELIGQADAVRPVGANAEPRQVRDNEQRRVLEGEGVLAQLVERCVEVGVLALVLPREAVAFSTRRAQPSPPVSFRAPRSKQ